MLCKCCLTWNSLDSLDYFLSIVLVDDDTWENNMMLHDGASFPEEFVILSFPEPRSKFASYRSWNSKMYPVWRDGDRRFRNSWLGEAHSSISKNRNAIKRFSLPFNLKMFFFPGGEVTFDLKNDAPTLTGARVTFSINLNFPPSQRVLSDGQVVWAENTTINGKTTFPETASDSAEGTYRRLLCSLVWCHYFWYFIHAQKK